MDGGNSACVYKLGVGVGLSYPPGQQKIRCVAMNLSEVENVVDGVGAGSVGVVSKWDTIKLMSERNL